MFILVKLFTREILFWKAIVRERERNGVSCCKVCAAPGEPSVCAACEEFLLNDNQPYWLKNAVLGEPAFQMTELSDEELDSRLWASRHGESPYLGQGSSAWAERLDFYSKLDAPFENIAELKEQVEEFHEYCREKGRHGGLLRKRKRSEGA